MAVQSAPVQETISIDLGYQRAKRIFDLTFTLIILIPLSFVFLIVAVLIKLDSEGPVFYRQKRIGQHGEEFMMLKFRSMYNNNSDASHRDIAKKYISGEIVNKDVNDPRITRIGRFIRKTSIDELPQFINVLRGEMSIVGPRPPVPYEVQQYSSRDWLRLAGKPGLTGTWQVYGRGHVTFRDMVEMDIDYLQNQSLWKDIKLVTLTVPVMINAKTGA